MATINLNSIMEKVKGYVNSYTGKERQRAYIEQLRHDGVGQTRGGGSVVTFEAMMRAANKLIDILKEHAERAGLPQSVLEHFRSLDYSTPEPYDRKQYPDAYRIRIFFADDLSRRSLMIVSGASKGLRTGEGIRDIVSLFDTGYDASARVFGTWDGHEDTGVVASRKHLDPGLFLEQAVEEFNLNWADFYDATAVLL